MAEMIKLDIVCILLDKLYLKALKLMEKHIQAKICLELCMCDGETYLTKSRYIMGQNQVSFLQLPTEDSAEFESIARVHTGDDNTYGQKLFDLEIKKQSNSDNRFQNPLNWFGVLVPQDLHKAQDKYQQALSWCIQSANIQTKAKLVIEE
ncbi:hypothetical protein RN001_013718 [Aquatica leii]|uniref:Vacuolar ATPase assembly protein VMA22 n=1 Tax=Aquatica leii TaxID=1421715 RepID=A0AAN7P371_9COLE|nr:hypothetical protein RN001_013718 [Aquatica leii]